MFPTRTGLDMLPRQPRSISGGSRSVNDTGLQTAGVNVNMHLIVCPNADQYAAEMAGQLA
jgi:hypothetical protein